MVAAKRKVPFFRVELAADEIDEVVDTLESGWLTTGPKTKQFERDFAAVTGTKHAVAVNSCTAALHLALEAIGLQRGDRVLVPTMTFAATAEVVRYFDAVPIFVDCEADSLCIDAGAAAEQAQRHGCKAIIPMHYGGQMCDMFAVRRLAREHGLAVIEDAAHTLPAAIRKGPRSPWKGPGQLSDIACFSFYANKCITTGEGGMAVTRLKKWADRMAVMSLHGMNRDAWKRYTSAGGWYYEIVAPGFKYNLTDVAAAIGVRQLSKVKRFWQLRRRVAERYTAGLADVDAIKLPVESENRQHSWHLYAIQLRLDQLRIDRNQFIDALKARGVACSVHWLPLHMQPYYIDTYGLAPKDFPIAARAWPRLVSLPIFPDMTAEEVDWVVDAIRTVVAKARR